jgi:EmrB/QacA subfamily drug resistance transporter
MNVRPRRLTTTDPSFSFNDFSEFLTFMAVLLSCLPENGRPPSDIPTRWRSVRDMTPAPGQGVGDGLALHSAKGRVALVATVAASAMASLDATVVNVALPHIGRDFHANVSSLQWVLTGYLLALASLILLGGALGDRYGRRKVFVIGTVWFAAASVLCGTAPNVSVLIGSRVLQGVGGALLTPGSLAILQSSFRESDRAAAVGAWSGLGGVAGAIGPFLGGGLVDGPGWRWAFLINVPVAALAIVCARAAVPESRDEHPRSGLDFRGAALAVAGLASLTWALTEAGPRGWSNTGVLAALAVGVGLVIAFVMHLRRTANPLVPPRLFRNRTFTVVNLATVLLYGALGVTFFLVSYELQVAVGWSALKAGVALLPATILMLVLSARSGALAQRIGPRVQLTVGPLLAGAGLLLLVRVGPGTSWTSDVLPGAVIFGMGLVTFVAPLTATVMAAADPDHVSVASGVNNAIARAASLAALAVVPVISGLTSAHGPAAVTHSFRVALVISACVAVAAAPLALIGLAPTPLARPSARRLHCALDGPPLQPDPARCPAPVAGSSTS